MRLYFDTSVLGAVLDREDERRIAVTREFLQTIAAVTHVGVISNVVQEELEQASAQVREAIVAEISGFEFELLLEDEETSGFSRLTRPLMSCPPDIEMICGMSPWPRKAPWMRWCPGISVIWSTSERDVRFMP